MAEGLTDEEIAAKLAEQHRRITKNDTVDHPSHYNRHPSGVECIDIVETFTFNIGNAMKYLWRAGLKSGDRIEDLRKAVWYVNREIQRLEKEPAKVIGAAGQVIGHVVPQRPRSTE